jgi:hypothetical protein
MAKQVIYGTESRAGLMLTTEVMISEFPESDKAQASPGAEMGY